MRVLITFAVEAEFAPWRKLRDLREVKVGDVLVHQTRIGRAQVDFVVTGMGLHNAKQITSAVLTKSHDICIASGFAGALRSRHRVGDILVADAVQFVGKAKTLQCGKGLVSKASSDKATRVKMLLTSDHLVRTAEEKAQLAPFADFVDMESFGVLSIAHEIGRPAVAIRVISDQHDANLPRDIELTMDQKGRVQVGRMLRYLSKYPISLPALYRLGRHSRTGAEALAAFLEAYIKKLSLLTHGWFPDGEGLEEVAAR